MAQVSLSQVKLSCICDLEYRIGVWGSLGEIIVHLNTRGTDLIWNIKELGSGVASSPRPHPAFNVYRVLISIKLIHCCTPCTDDKYLAMVVCAVLSYHLRHDNTCNLYGPYTQAAIDQ